MHPDGEKLATYRAGQYRADMVYIVGDWREHGIRAARFAPCPHCGSAVSGRERTLTAASRFGPKVFRHAQCSNPDCGWTYSREGGTREEFVSAVNRRWRGTEGIR